MSELRNPHIESLLRTMKDMGRPIKTDIIRDKEGTNIFFEKDVKGKVQIVDVVKIK